MAKAKSGSSTKSAPASNYERNRERRLARHLKKHPNDLQSAKREGNLNYRRKTPKVKTGWTFKAFAQVPMEFRKNILGKHNMVIYSHVLKNLRIVENEMKHLPKEVRSRRSK